MNAQQKRIDINNEMLKLNKRFLEHQAHVGRLYTNEAKSYLGGFEATPIGSGESHLEGGSFTDFLKSMVELPLSFISAPLQMVKKVVTGSGKSRKSRAKKAKKGGADAEPIYTDIGVVAPVPRVNIEPIHATPFHQVQQNATTYSVPLAANGTGKPRKARAPKCKKGGSLLSTLSDLAHNFVPSVYNSPLDDWIPPEVTRGIAKKIAEKAGGAESGGAKKAKTPNRWLEYVRGISHQHPGMKYKDVLILAKKTYHAAK